MPRTLRNLPLLALVAVLALSLAACCGTRPIASGCTTCAAPAAAPVVAVASEVAVAAPSDVVPCNDGGAPVVAPDDGSRPPHAKPGEAWCRVWEPPVTETYTETVCVEPAKRTKMWIPPEYGSRMKIVCVAPASLKEVDRPGVWTTRSRDVIDCPEREVWECTNCPTAQGTGDPCGCKPQACVVGRKIPPTFKTIKERVCIAPPRRELKYRPAQYKCVEERYLIKEGFCQEICEPARYEVRERTRTTCEGRWRWVRRNDCEIPVETPPPAPPPETLPALEVRMEDMSAAGAPQGIFGQGEEVRYDLVVLSDAASDSMPDMRVVFTIPEHLEFVSGGGEGLTISGAGQMATSSDFSLSVGQVRTLHLRVRVKSVPPNNLVQLTASVQALDGTELAIETESTTLKAAE